MSWVPAEVSFRRPEEPVLRYERIWDSWPAGTRQTADMLDHLGVPKDAPVRVAQQALREGGEGRRTTVVMAAQRYPRSVSRESGNAARESGGKR
jgi:hypothetical protein